MRKLPYATAALAIAVSAAPALAADPPPSHDATATVKPEAGAPSQRNPLLADNGDVRMSKLIGTNVYNQQDQKLGSVDDVLMGSDGQPSVVISADGRLVQVPWTKLTFGNAKINSNNKAIMPDETQQAMKQMPEFRYTAKD
jgi:ribosomal 30S subunit maturation factor RimM